MASTAAEEPTTSGWIAWLARQATPRRVAAALAFGIVVALWFWLPAVFDLREPGAESGVERSAFLRNGQFVVGLAGAGLGGAAVLAYGALALTGRWRGFPLIVAFCAFIAVWAVLWGLGHADLPLVTLGVVGGALLGVAAGLGARAALRAAGGTEVG